MNPHFWYDIPRVPRVAAAFAAALARLDPRDAASFAANLAAFDRSLGPVQAVLRGIRRRCPGAPVAYTERLPGYLLQAAGLRVLTPAGVRARDLARQSGVPVLAITETMPSAFRTYQAWQLTQATALLHALGERQSTGQAEPRSPCARRHCAMVTT